MSTLKKTTTGNTELVFSIGATEQARFTGGNLVFPLGQGINFATASGSGSSELFDSYEEGTFTPVVKGSTTAGTSTYATQMGAYTRIGNRVFFDISLSWADHTGAGFLKVGSLPYAPSGMFSSCSIGNFSNIPLADSTYAIASVKHDAGEIEFREILVGGGSSGLVSMDAAGIIEISGMYSV